MKVGDTVKTTYGGKEISATVKSVGEGTIDVTITTADGTSFVRGGLVEVKEGEGLHDGQYRVK